MIKIRLPSLILVLFVTLLTACGKSDQNPIQTPANHAADIVKHNIQSIECNKIIDFSSNDDMNFYHSQGLSGFEEWGRWSDGEKVVIKFLMSHNECVKSTVTFKLNGFVREGKLTQSARVFLNGVKIGDLKINFDENNPQDFVLNIPSRVTETDEMNVLEFKVVDPASPKSLGLGEDPRLLGFGFESMVFE